MSPVADLIGAVASLLWPLLVIVVLLVFGRQLLSKLRNSDDVTLEIGGQRLNLKQATDQQSDMITDLQREVAALRKRLDDVGVGAAGGWADAAGAGSEVAWGGSEGEQHEADPADELIDFDRPDTQGALPGSPPHSILWVDDHPENNAMLAESWRREGAEVDTARTTDEAMRLLTARRYGLVISDMGRHESGIDVPDAGLRLLTKVRATDAHVPFVLYGNVEQVSDVARAAGATLVTGSTFELVEFASSVGVFQDA
ncbi:response regulator [Promicromonospora kroppenstedtii]|uniref:response regulator n=1 Tax=Promicromonospora kroppenstedtii TaxID=440482 RepID=UPI0004AE3D5D|nr:response regulator [Promicromonospora kroppenstedtii]